MNRYLFSFVALAILLVTTFFLFQGSVREWRKNIWMKTEGTVLSVELSESKIQPRIGEGFAVTELRYIPLIRYQYRVRNQEYFSSVIFDVDFIETFHTREGAERFLSRYGEGQKVNVYYKPVHPEISALIIRQDNRAPQTLLTLIAFIASIYIALCIYRDHHLEIKKRLKSRAEKINRKLQRFTGGENK